MKHYARQETEKPVAVAGDETSRHVSEMEHVVAVMCDEEALDRRDEEVQLSKAAA